MKEPVLACRITNERARICADWRTYQARAFIQLQRSATLTRAISSIVDELHNEYRIGYPCTVGQPGEQRRVEVRLTVRNSRFAHAPVTLSINQEL